MKCPDVQEKLPMLLQADVEKELLAGLQDHVHTCPACASQLRALQEDHQRLLAFTDRLDLWISEATSRPVVVSQVKKEQPLKWRTVMSYLLAHKYRAAGLLIVVVGLVVLWSLFPSSSLALAQVIQKIEANSYAFDVTFAGTATSRVKVLKPGRVRIECGSSLGNVISLIDYSKGQSLLLFPRQKAAYIFDIPDTLPPDQHQPMEFWMTRAVEQLWNLRDGTEEPLGRRRLDGRDCTGFEITGEISGGKCEISVWAETATAHPVCVEVLIQSDAQDSLEYVMDNFALNQTFDEAFFSTTLPAGYTLSQSQTLEDITTSDTSPTDTTAQDILQAIRKFAAGDKDQAAGILLAVDWSGPIEFPRNAYLFTMTEAEYISLVAGDQQTVMTTIMNDSSIAREIARYLADAAEQERAAGNLAQAQKQLETIKHFGSLLSRNPQGMVVVRVVGIAVEILSLKDLTELYADQGDQEAVQHANDRHLNLKAQLEEIKKNASGRR